MNQDYTLLPALLWYEALDQLSPKANIRVNHIVKNEALDLASWDCCLAILEKTMPVKRLLCSVLFLVSAYGCDKSSSVGDDGTNSGGDDGGAITTELIELNVGNIRSSTEKIAQRLNMVTAEIYRTLKPFLYSDDPALADPILTQALEELIPIDVDAAFALANDGTLPVDPLSNFSCRIAQADAADELMGVGGLEFRDNDADDAFSPDDQLIFSYNANGCELMKNTSYERAPSSVAGIIEFTFAVGSAVNVTPRRLVGTVRFRNYQYNNGLLAHRGGDVETVLSGAIDFDIEFVSQTVNRATFTNGSVVLERGTDLLPGPVDLTFDLIERELNAATVSFAEGNYNTRLENVVAFSPANAVGIEFHTIGYPDPAGIDQTLFGDFDSYPQSGALAIIGGSNTAGLFPAQPSASRITNALVDTNDDGFFESEDLFEPTSWSFLMGQFLVPGNVAFLTADD